MSFCTTHGSWTYWRNLEVGIKTKGKICKKQAFLYTTAQIDILLIFLSL